MTIVGTLQANGVLNRQLDLGMTVPNLILDTIRLDRIERTGKQNETPGQKRETPRAPPSRPPIG